MRYAYKDLGEQRAGTTIALRLEGSAANVLLLDPHNYLLYRARKSFQYHGGLCGRSRTTLTVPSDGRWYLVVDLGGHRGRVRARIQRIDPPEGHKGSRSARRPAGEALEPVA